MKVCCNLFDPGFFKQLDIVLQREIMTGAGSDGTSSVINKWYPNNGSGGDGRVYSLYSEGVHQNYGGWPLAWGDYLGDWR